MSKRNRDGNSTNAAKPATNTTTLGGVRRLFRSARTVRDWTRAMRAAESLSTPDVRRVQSEANASQHRIVVARVIAAMDRAFADAAVAS